MAINCSPDCQAQGKNEWFQYRLENLSCNKSKMPDNTIILETIAQNSIEYKIVDLYLSFSVNLGHGRCSNNVTQIMCNTRSQDEAYKLCGTIEPWITIQGNSHSINRIVAVFRPAKITS